MASLSRVVGKRVFLDVLDAAILRLECRQDIADAEPHPLEYVPDGVSMNPYDWRKIQTIKTEDGRTINKGAPSMPT